MARKRVAAGEEPERFAYGQIPGCDPNFYARYCAAPGRSKPMAITETAAFYKTQMPGPSEFLIKQAWWTQVLEAPKQFPMLKCVNWFDELKRETVAQNDLIDWRISANPQIREAFVSDLRVDGLGDHFLTEMKRCASRQITLRRKSCPKSFSSAAESMYPSKSKPKPVATW
jgi:hypothetical protein